MVWVSGFIESRETTSISELEQAIMRKHMRIQPFLAAAVLLAAASCGQAQPNKPTVEEIRQAKGLPSLTTRIVSYNIENWRYSFLAHKVWPTSQPTWSEDLLDLVQRERREDDEENWEVARTILHADVKPDIMVIQEACDQRDLNFFNTQFLRGYFETVHIFPSNTNRGQNIGILMRPGYKVLEYRENFKDIPDTNDANPESDKLFARGPAFVKVEGPSGAIFWVGTNHAKSKSGNSVEATRWRNAEAVATHKIINDLRKEGPNVVIFLGDLNDELGIQEFEKEAGGSAIELLAGTGPDALKVVTKQLADAGKLSYHGGRSSRFESFIDHAVLTPEAAAKLKDVRVFTGDLADVASDHYPVILEMNLQTGNHEGP
jgi:endonuclease/exonuclease/phosphatase family metal-dependent hydrolase